MQAYKVLLPGYERSFTYITAEPLNDIADCIFERFGVYPLEIIKL